MLYTIHSVAAAITKVRVLDITKDGSEKLAEAIMQVTEMYEVPMLSEKGMAWLNLASVAAQVYIFDANPGKPVGVARQGESKAPIPMPSFMAGKTTVN